MYDICGNSLNVPTANYTSLNRIVAQVISSCTASMRFTGAINVDLMEYMTNLIPFPRLKYPIVSYAPFIPKCGGGLSDVSNAQITQACFQPKNSLIKVDMDGKWICCCLLYRGDIQLTEINATISDIKMKRANNFVEWSPTSFKIGLNYQPPTCVPGGDMLVMDKAACMLSNK